jgi:hypothetical protein
LPRCVTGWATPEPLLAPCCELTVQASPVKHNPRNRYGVPRSVRCPVAEYDHAGHDAERAVSTGVPTAL